MSLRSAPTTIDLLAESDSGTSSTDNITNAQTLNFAVGGTTVGAMVEVLAGGNVVGTATASSATTNVMVNNVAGSGARLGVVHFAATRRRSQQQSFGGACAVVLDSQAPAAIASGVIPANTLVEQPLSVDLNIADEGQGLIYALTGAPAGMTIDSNTGLLELDPVHGAIGREHRSP